MNNTFRNIILSKNFSLIPSKNFLIFPKILKLHLFDLSIFKPPDIFMYDVMQKPSIFSTRFSEFFPYCSTVVTILLYIIYIDV